MDVESAYGQFDPFEYDEIPAGVNTVRGLQRRSLSGSFAPLGFAPSTCRRLRKVQLMRCVAAAPPPPPLLLLSSGQLNHNECSHGGCVNCANFNTDGSLLATGSDDLLVKVWRSPSGFCTSDVALRLQIDTSHQHNIFHVAFNPAMQTRLASCSADGHVICHDMNNSAAETVVMQYPAMVNMFAFAPEPSWNGYGHVFFTAAYAGESRESDHGCVDAVDTRLNMHLARRLLAVSSVTTRGNVKAVDASPWNDYELLVGVGDQVWALDTRFNDVPTVVWSLRNALAPSTERCARAMEFFAPSCGAHDRLYIDTATRAHEALARSPRLPAESNGSVSSLVYSRLRQEALVSLQGDAIYSIALEGAYDGAAGEPVQMYAGALNEKTFLKRASYFGPDEDYVASGGDDGNVYLWHRATGRLVSIKPADRFARGDGDVDSDGGIVNGVVPHPQHPVLVSYGLDSHAKLHVPCVEAADGDVAADENAFDTGVLGAAEAARRQPLPLDEYMRATLARNQELACVPQTLGESIVFSPRVFLARTSRMRDALASKLLGEDVGPSAICRAAPPAPRLSAEWFLFWLQTGRDEAAALRERGNAAYAAGKDALAMELYLRQVSACAGADVAALEWRMASGDPSPLTRCVFPRARNAVPHGARPRVQASDEQKSAARACEDELRELTKVAFLNASAAALRLGNWGDCVKCASSVAQLEPDSAKARYRLALAFIGLRDKRRAVEQLRALERLRGTNPALLKEAWEKIKAL